MDQLWAPWRHAYVAKDDLKPKDGECFICRGLSETEDRRNLILHRTPLGLIQVNKFPYNNGHLLVAPRAHKGELHELTAEESSDLQQGITRVVGVLRRLLKPDGFNVGLNVGSVAGAGLPGHLHWHVVPRWSGDTNFMPVFADVRVISQSLESLYDLLYPELNPA